jgi:hypothetical protein
MKALKLAIFVILAASVSSCVPVKKMIYLQSEEEIKDKVFEYQNTVYKKTTFLTFKSVL